MGKTVYLWLRFPNGRNSIKKFKTTKKSSKAIRREYMDTAHHFNNETFVEDIFTKKPTKTQRKYMY